MKRIGLVACMLLGCHARVSGDEAPAAATDTVTTTGATATDTGLDSESVDETGPPTDECDWTPQMFGEPPRVPAECEALLSVTEGVPVTLRVTNDGDETVFIGGPIGCNPVSFVLEDADGRVYPGDRCTPSCDASLARECGCTADCPMAPTIAITPGGSYDMGWPGIVAELPVASLRCAGECGGECRRAVAPAPGAMQVVLLRRHDVVCDGAPGCECTPNEQGWCALPGFADGESQVLERTVQWPPACPLIELSVP